MRAGSIDGLGTWRRAAAAVVAAIGVLVASSAAAQVSNASAYNPYVCNDLAARLAAASKVPASRADRWAGAIAEQRSAIASNQSQLSRCGGGSDPRCTPLMVRGEQMAANLAKLEREYAQLGGARASAAGSPERARIEAAMAQAHCNDRGRSSATVAGQPPAGVRAGETPPGVGGYGVRAASAPRPADQARPAEQQRRSFFSILFGGEGEAQPGEETAVDPADQALQEQMSGSYRTMCVRTCDGFFFPISFQASRGRLRTDANVCSALCPGTETRLYYHGTGQEAEQAIAADSGEPITKLANAFVYRTRVVPGCACGKPDPRLLPAAAGGLRGWGREAARLIDPSNVTLPRPRPSADQDPETQAAQLAGFDPQPVTTKIEAVAEGDTPTPATLAERADEQPRVVRTVGPKWLSDR